MENNNLVLGRILAVEELNEVTGARPDVTLAYYVETDPSSDGSSNLYDSGTTADSGTSSDSGIFTETLVRRPEAGI